MAVVFDIFITLVVLIFGFIGFRSGFVKNSFSIAALLIAIVVATKFMNPVGEVLRSLLLIRGDVAITIAFALIFVGFMVLEWVIYGFRKEESVFLIWDKIGAIWLGFIEGVAIISLTLILLGLFEIPSAETQQKSLFYKRVVGFAPWIYDKIVGVLPQATDFHEQLGKNFEKYRVPPP